MFIRKVFKLSSSLKNLSFSSQNVFAYHLSHVENLKGTRDIQEYTEDNNDKLALELKSSSLSKVLITLQKNSQAVQGSHITMAMSSFYRFMKKEASAITGDHTEPMTVEWKEHPFYKDMFYIIKSNYKKLTGPETVQILYYTKRMKGLSQMNEILIQHLYKNLKDLSLKDFRVIVSLFKKCDRFKYLVRLEKAMVRSFIMKVSMNHQKDIDYLVDGLYFLSCNNSGINCNKLLDVFVEDLYNYKNDIALNNALIIHESLYSMRYYPKKSIELIKKVQENIINNIAEMMPIQINYIVFFIANRIKANNEMKELYCAVFIDKLIQKLICEDAGFENALSALRCLIDMRHYNVEILNYVCASYFEKTALKYQQITNHRGKVSVIITGLACANYKSIFWNEVENYIMNEKTLLKNNCQTLCIMSLNAICLDCYPTEILKQLYESNYDFSKNYYLHQTFCKIYQRIRTNPLYKGPQPTQSQIESMNAMFRKSLRSKKSFPILPFLEEGMGSPTYVKTKLGTKLLHIIDHVVVFDKEGFPIPINSELNINGTIENIEYLEDLEVPQGSKIVTLICTPSIWYFRNTNKLMGPYKVYFDTLEKMNYNVVDINSMTWNEIPDKEKSFFLLSAIKSKLKTSITT